MKRKEFIKGIALVTGTGLVGDLIVSGCNEQQNKRIQEAKRQNQKNIAEKHIYKKKARDGLVDIDAGKYKKAEKYYKDLLNKYSSLYPSYLDKFPTDLEALFALTLTYGQMGKLKKALEHAKEAVRQGLPFERFLAGPRYLVSPLLKAKGFKEWANQYQVELLHGPMLSKVTDHSAEFWVRTAQEVPVGVKISPSESMVSTQMGKAKTQKSRDYTANLSISQLKSDTKYYYQILVDGKLQPNKWSFKTYPPVGKSAQFKMGFGGCAGYTPWKERMWNTVADHDFLAFLFMGDNVYIDHPLYPGIQRYCYYRRQSRPEFKNFIAGSSIYATWDDHDFAGNDSHGGPRDNEQNWKQPVLKVFKENWNNPTYGGGRKKPGLWFSFSIADVDFFVLDDRYYKTGSDADQPSMLGAVQKKWFFDNLKASEATFKIIACGVPWAFDSKPGPANKDTWFGYKEERNEIFSFLAKEKIEGVVLIAGDRHRAELRKISHPGLYDLYSMENCLLTNVHTHACPGGSIFCYNKKNVFGRLTFNTKVKDPYLIYDICTIDNEKPHSIKIKKSQLIF